MSSSNDLDMTDNFLAPKVPTNVFGFEDDDSVDFSSSALVNLRISAVASPRSKSQNFDNYGLVSVLGSPKYGQPSQERVIGIGISSETSVSTSSTPRKNVAAKSNSGERRAAGIRISSETNVSTTWTQQEDIATKTKSSKSSWYFSSRLRKQSSNSKNKPTNERGLDHNFSSSGDHNTINDDGVKKPENIHSKRPTKTLNERDALKNVVTKLERDKIDFEQRQRDLAEIWLKDILPNWDKKKKSKRVRDLIFSGVPAHTRGKVWPTIFGNPLNLTQELYDLLIEQSLDAREKYLTHEQGLEKADGDLGGGGGHAEEFINQDTPVLREIMLDIPRTFPHLGLFNSGSPYYNHLLEVLEAYVCLRPEQGYVQGMSYIAAFLILYLDPFPAFCCFTTMMQSHCFSCFFNMRMPEVNIYLQVFEKLLSEELPYLHNHFKTMDIRPNMYMINWIMSLYTVPLPIEVTPRIWDCYFLDGEVIFFRAALGILKMLSKTLLKLGFDDCASLLSHLPKLDADALVTNIRAVHVCSERRILELFRYYEAQDKKSILSPSNKVKSVTSPPNNKATSSKKIRK